MSEEALSAPGLSIQTLLRHSKPKHLKELIGPGIIEVLDGLDTHLLDGNRLAELAVRLLDPSELLRQADRRDRIISMLPLPKARELAARLNVQDGRDLFPSLKAAAAERRALPTLLSFFGVVTEERAPVDARPNLGRAEPIYGLFDHQRQAALKTIRRLQQPPRKVVLHMPTGAGKTRTAMHIVADHFRAVGPTVVCWLAQNAELLDQAADEFEKAWGHLGNRSLQIARFWGGRHTDIMSVQDSFVVAGLSKLHAYNDRNPAAVLRFADRVSLVIIDEAHQAIAPTYASILSTLSRKRSTTGLLGLTATPGRTWSNVSEDQKLSEFFEEQKVTLEVDGYSDPVTFLIEEGYLARPTFRTLNSGAGLKLSASDIRALADSIDIPDSVLEHLGADAQRNLKIVSELEELAKRHRRIIVFAPSVESARLLAAILFVRGYEADVVTGESSSAERERIVRRFRSDFKKPMILCNFGVLTTGFDAPSISAALIARPTRSLVLYSQMVGRATRGPRAGGNAEAEIVTVVDPHLPGFGNVAEAFTNWEDVWREPG